MDSEAGLDRQEKESVNSKMRWNENHLVMSRSLQPHGLCSPWNSPGQNTGKGSHSLLRDLPNPGVKPRSPTPQANSLPTEPPGKPKNAGIGSLSLLQRIFPTQELNWGLLHCRQILYQLSYQGSPVLIYVNAYFYIPVFTPISSLFPLINLIPISGLPRWH